MPLLVGFGLQVREMLLGLLLDPAVGLEQIIRLCRLFGELFVAQPRDPCLLRRHSQRSFLQMGRAISWGVSWMPMDRFLLLAEMAGERRFLRSCAVERKSFDAR
ncbi:hypothetical protein [Teichococcus deserti]|nr:hypothetical protein [Pseudoroseomonas deserti]